MLKIFAVYDVKAEIYGSPIFLRTVSEATRSLSQMVMGVDNVIAQYPDDFHLYELGDYQPRTGVIIPHDNIVFVCTARSQIDQQPLFDDADLHDPTKGII